MSFRNSVCLTAATLLFAVESTVLPNSCKDLEDGEYWMKLIDGDNYPPVKLKCSNGYTILDYNQDNNLAEYFSSWVMWHYAIAGPLNGDVVNWNSWYLDGTQSKYLVSPDCSVCEEESGWQKYNDESTYWMSGNVFGCFWSMKAFHNCDMDFDSYECYSCAEYSKTYDTDDIISMDESIDGAQYYWTGMCVDAIRSASASIPESHDSCTEQNGIGDFKPSIGTDGRYCVCVQPSESKEFEIDETVYNEYVASLSEKSKEEIEEVTEYTSSNHVVELYAIDFEFGTYRIKTPGTYKIMEDIEFNFNAGDYSNAQKDGAWMPQEDQVDEYPGAAQYRDSYFLGFFAGITVECDDVIIDLNGHTLRQADEFYFQQRWFTIIELASQQFLPGQGPGFFGNDPQFASNVEIRDGTLGLTSHHGIHGNYNKNVKLQNLVIRQFETHGIQLNGFENVEMNNVDVGPTSTRAYLRAEYGHMRMILPRLRKIATDNQDGTIRFDARDEEWTASDLADELEKQMNMAYNFALNGIEPNVDDEDDLASWESAQSVFLNKNGIPYGSVQHGIFLNTEGTSVFNYNLETTSYSSNVQLNDVKIHGMRHAMDEWVRFSKNAEIYVTSFTSPIDGGAILGDQLDTKDNLADIESSLEYRGNIVTDTWIALDKLTTDWGMLGSLLVGNNRMIPWVEGTGDYESYTFGCNVDAMLHSGKGVLGLRIDGVEQLYANNLEIYSLYDKTPLGREECGSYTDYSFKDGGGHFRQVSPMQIGFSGNMVQGIAINAVKNSKFENVNVHDLTSETGAAIGIAVWPGNEITFDKDITVYNVYAGTKVDYNSLSWDDRPNRAPQGCGILDYGPFLDTATKQVYDTTVTFDEDSANINSGCISGHVGCAGTNAKTNIGDFGTVDGCTPYTPSTNSNSNSQKFGKVVESKLDRVTSSNKNNIVENEESNESIKSGLSGNIWSFHPIMFVIYGLVGFIVVYMLAKFAMKMFNINHNAVKKLDNVSYSLLKTQLDTAGCIDNDDAIAGGNRYGSVL